MCMEAFGKPSRSEERDDFLGKNQCRRSVYGNAPEGPYHDTRRKRTEDMDDLL